MNGPISKLEEKYLSFANLIVDYSVKVKKGDVVIVENFDTPDAMTEALIKKIQERGAHPIIWLKKWQILRALLKKHNHKELLLAAESELRQMKTADVYISIRASMNSEELAGIDKKNLLDFQKDWLAKVHYRERVQNTRWCSIKWPTEIAAKQANMDYGTFEKYYIDICVDFDYKKMSAGMDSLIEILNKTNLIRIVSPGTDLSFKKGGIPSKKSAGDVNIPDGEVFTAPIKNSVNGYITYNIPSEYNSHSFEKIKFTFKKGKIIKASCKKGSSTFLNSILDTDPGARYIGEFAFGLNPLIRKPINDRMFDEKMAGSIHFTPGNSYKVAGNKNKSSVHWDLILNQMPEFGGGEIFFDGKLIRKDGLFIIPELKKFNP